MSSLVGNIMPQAGIAAKEGNPYRSTCLLGYGAKVFCSAGFLIVNPNLTDVQDISIRNMNSGHDKKKGLTPVSLTENQKKQKIQKIKEDFMAGKVDTHSEILYHIKHASKKSFDAIYYDSDEESTRHLPLLKALFLQEEHVKIHGKPLSIFQYCRQHNLMHTAPEINREKLVKLWVESIEDFFTQKSDSALTSIAINYFSQKENQSFIINTMIELFTSETGLSLIHYDEDFKKQVILEIEARLSMAYTQAPEMPTFYNGHYGLGYFIQKPLLTHSIQSSPGTGIENKR